MPPPPHRKEALSLSSILRNAGYDLDPTAELDIREVATPLPIGLLKEIRAWLVSLQVRRGHAHEHAHEHAHAHALGSTGTELATERYAV